VLVIGLTGGIASGKTAVSNLFAEHGVPIVDTDILARELVQPGQPALQEIVRHFGQDCLLPNGALDRRYLRTLIFANDKMRKTLEEILHPRIHQCVKRRLAALHTHYCLVVIPLLAEKSQLRRLLNRILVVDVPETIQIERVMARDNINITQAEQILAAQATRSERLSLADEIITNDGDLQKLEAAVYKLHQQYIKLAGKISCDTQH
jgi:dephospho-CoA kinase